MAEPKRSRKKIYILGAIALLIVAAVVAKVVSGKREKPILVTTEKAFRTNITQLVTATGKIQPEIEVKISPEVSGEIIEHAGEGRAGRPQGRAAPAHQAGQLRAQVEAQQAALNGARSGERAAPRRAVQGGDRIPRVQKLFEARPDLRVRAERRPDQPTTSPRRRSIPSQFDDPASEGALRQINDALSKTTIYSPTTGTISSLTSRARRARGRHQPVRRHRSDAHRRPRSAWKRASTSTRTTWST